MQGLACEQAESYGSYPQYYHASPGSSGAETSAASSDESSHHPPSQILSVDQRLRQLYKEEGTSKKPCPSRLLRKLVAREGLGVLLVQLFPGDQGYKITITDGHGRAGLLDNGGNADLRPRLPTIVSSYEEDDLLPFIDREELPPAIADLLEDSPVPLFYAGCVVAEVVDMRHCPAGHSRFVLLKPSDQSLLCDINQLTSEGNWSAQDKLELESQLILATQGPLCLDPSPSVAVHNARARYQGLDLNSAPLRRLTRKYSQSAINKRRRLSQYLNLCSTPLLRFLDKRPPRSRPSPPVKLPPQMANGHVEPPDPSEVLRLGLKACEEPIQSNECLPQLVEEYILQTERAQGRVYHIKLSLLQRPSTTEYFGELYVDRDFKEGQRNGASCRFSLGTQWHAKKYIDQFCEIFTEEGRKLVTITHIVPGKPVTVTNTWEKKEEENKVEELAINPLLMHKPHTLNNPVIGVPSQLVQQQQLQQQQQQQQQQQHVQQQVHQQLARVQTSPTKATSPTRHSNATNAAISALATSLMNSAQQFQQQAAANAAPQQVAQKGRRTSNTLLTARLNAPVQQIAPQVSPQQPQLQQQSLLSPQPARMSALTSQLNAPPVIAPAQPFVNFSYAVPSKMVATLRPAPAQTATVVASANATFTQAQPGRQPSPQQIPQSMQQQVQVQQVQEQSNLGLTMPGLSALLAGTPSADNPMPGAPTSTPGLLERLTSPTVVPTYVAPAPTPPSPVATSQSPKPITPSPMSSPSTLSLPNINLQLASLQEAMARVPAFQNVQVSIPGLPNPISLSLNVSQNAVQPSGVIVPTLPIANTATLTSQSVVAPAPSPQPLATQLGTLNVSPANHTMLLAANTMAATGQVLSLPVAQVMAPAGVKTAIGQGIRPSSPMAIPQLTQTNPQSIQLLGAIPGQVQRRGLIQRSPTNTTTLKLQGQNPQTSLQAALGQPVVTLTTQQQLQLALQKHPQLQQCLNQQKVNVKPRRRSSAAEPK